MAMETVNLVPEGFRAYGNGVIGYVKNGKLYLNQEQLKIMIEEESQIDELKDQVPPGTKFFLAGSGQYWQLGADGELVQNEIDGSFFLDPDDMNLYYTTEGA